MTAKLKNTQEGINSRLEKSEDWINKLEYKIEKKHPVRAAIRKKKYKAWGWFKEALGQHEM